MTRLTTERASQAAVTQRAGRAARQGPGVAYRLWEAAATAGLPRFDPAEILEADLSALVLECGKWGVSDPTSLRWLDPPPAAAVEEARARLATLDAIDGDGRPTPHGLAIAALPLSPRLAHMLIRAGKQGFAGAAAEVAVLLGERGLGGNDTDLDQRRRRWRTERGQRADASRRLAERWRRLVKGHDDPPADALARSVALAFPDRIARRRDASGERWASVGGRGFKLDAAALGSAEWLAVAETQGQAAGARILSAVAIDQATVEHLFGNRIETRRSVTFDPATRGVVALRERRLGAIRLSSGPDAAASPDEIVAALVDAVRRDLSLLPFEGAETLRRRSAYVAAMLGQDDPLGDAALSATIDDWLPPLLAGKRRLEAVTGLHDVLEQLAGWDWMQQLRRLAPARFESPAGSSHAIDYAAEGGPRVELRVQALFGLAVHPMVAGQPLTLSLTSPAGRPIQTTRDLPGFWAGSWRDVSKEMRGRYPRHPWPDDPAAASATLRTKKADARRG